MVSPFSWWVSVSTWSSACLTCRNLEETPSPLACTQVSLGARFIEVEVSMMK